MFSSSSSFFIAVIFEKESFQAFKKLSWIDFFALNFYALIAVTERVRLSFRASAPFLSLPFLSHDIISRLSGKCSIFINIFSFNKLYLWKIVIFLNPKRFDISIVLKVVADWRFVFASGQSNLMRHFGFEATKR